jgi:hypothetical protein
MTDDEDDGAISGLLAQEFLQEASRAFIQAGPRLVQEEEVGPMNQGPAQGHALRLAPAECRERLFGKGRHRQAIDDAVDGAEGDAM